MAALTQSTEAAALEIQHMSFAYPSGKRVLDDISLTVHAGEFVALSGDTGSGKTTLLRLIKPEIAPAGILSGEIRVFGKNINTEFSAQESKSIGYVFQNPDTQLVCESVLGELAFGLECRSEDAPAMRKKIAEVVSLFGMTEWISCNVDELSGGQKQLVNLASLLIMQPALLLLDEPTAQLDPISARLFLDMLFHINRDFGIAVIVATHNPEELSPYGVRTVALEQGRLVESPAASSLADTPFLTLTEEEEEKASYRRYAHTHGNHERARPTVSFKDVTYAYEQASRPTLQHLSLDIYPGEIVALVGGNGSGKSTTLKLAAGILKPLAGTILNERSQNQAYLPQDPQVLFSGDTVFEELSEWRETTRYPEQAIFEIAEYLNFKAYFASNPFDISGGQQQAIALAKLMLCAPELLVLDEPIKGLDAKMCFAVARKLKEISNEGTTVVIATHNIAFAACVADRMIMLFDGSIAADQAPIDFCKDNYFYRPRSNAFTRMWKAWLRDGYTLR